MTLCVYSQNTQNHEILYMRKPSAVRYVSGPQCIENLHIIDKMRVQHQVLDQTNSCGEI